MKSRLCSAGLLCFALIVFSHPARAGLLSGGMTVPSRADQMIRLYPGTPLNAGPGVVEVPTSAVGQFAVTWAAQNPGDNFASVTGFVGQYASSPSDPLGSYTINAPASSSADSFRGRLTEIVESGGSLVSAKLTIETTFGVTLAALGGGTVFTINDFSSAAPEDHFSVFTGNLHAGVVAGEVFGSPDNTNIYANVPGLGQVAVGQSFKRQVIAIPEPSACTLLTVGALGLVRRRRPVEGVRHSRSRRTT